MKKVIVIGGGLGGISAAASLACEGFQVELFEKNAHLGGKLNVLTRDGFSFDLGPSILTMPHVFEALFHTAGARLDERLSLRRLDPQFAYHWPAGGTLTVHDQPDVTAAAFEEFGRGAGREYQGEKE